MSENGGQEDGELDQEPTKDHVRDEFRADNGVRVKRVSNNEVEGPKDWLKVYGTREDRFASLGGGEPNTVSREVLINEMPANVAYEVLVGLAEAHGYELVPK